MSTIITGIIGFGLSGSISRTVHGRAGGFELSKISTTNPKSIRIIEERYPVTAVVPTERHHRRPIDCVVASPNEVHFHWA